ncbi:DNA repair protein [Candidatus Photodesmus blepharus]|uniref:DNA repair protein RecO n=1 Tax=Candidatus Photodesmus blepharonis TaxID=1179155 RepID=A0A084CNV4_9GAMM|nr:DNA repair protein RecO [Candidatus Photodesmus blepharus]KEY91483.1 DNA repair protein [Candidatus Photodesmus blepharus]
MDNRLQRCFIIHRRVYGESSFILDVFSEESGRVTLISKGSRSKYSNLRGILQSFTPLLLQWFGSGSIKTLAQAEAIALGLPLSGIALYSAMYVNELIDRVLVLEVAMPALFRDYLHVLIELAQADNPEPALRRFELALLAEMGYGVDFLHCAENGHPIDPELIYRYRAEEGFVLSVRRDSLTFFGRELVLFSKRQFITKEELRAVKRFTRIALKAYLGNKPFKSRELFFPKTSLSEIRSVEK